MTTVLTVMMVVGGVVHWRRSFDRRLSMGFRSVVSFVCRLVFRLFRLGRIEIDPTVQG